MEPITTIGGRLPGPPRTRGGPAASGRPGVFKQCLVCVKATAIDPGWQKPGGKTSQGRGTSTPSDPTIGPAAARTCQLRRTEPDGRAPPLSESATLPF